MAKALNNENVVVRGMEELLNSMKVLPSNIKRNIVNGAVRASAAAIVKEAKANVPKDEGDLKRSLKVVKRKSKDKHIVAFTVSPSSKEFHKIQDAKNERHYNYGGHVEFGSSKTQAHPFLRPAFENQGQNAIDIFKKYMAKRIDKEIAKS